MNNEYNLFNLSTNLTDLPGRIFKNLALSLECNELWLIIATEGNDPIFQLK